MDKQIKLHLACGIRNFGEEWIHIDGGDFSHLHSKDITKLPFKGNEVDLIYCSHAIEYFDRDEIILVLNEWKRVLKPGGMLRLAVPDFETMIDLYHDCKIKLEDILGPLYGKWKMGDFYVYHKTTYDYRSLETLLKEIGFKNIQPYDWHRTEHAHIDDHSMAYLHPKGDKIEGTLISLNVECIK